MKSRLKGSAEFIPFEALTVDTMMASAVGAIPGATAITSSSGSTISIRSIREYGEPQSSYWILRFITCRLLSPKISN